MPLIEINRHPTQRQLRQFAGLVLPLCGVLLAALVWSRTGQRAVAGGIVAGTALIALCGLYRPALARSVYLGWMYAAYPFGWLIGHAMLCAVFFLIVTPLGLLMRAVGRDPLQRKFDASRASYWKRRAESDRTRYFRQF
jgi:Na+/proline symporter